MKHTPGPWLVVKEPNGVIYVDGDLSTVCDLYQKERAGTHYKIHQFINADANANLIAAAPDLLDALKLALVNLECGAFNTSGKAQKNYSNAANIARQAIKKAEGEL